jgi:hypothetical protein
MAKTCLRLEGTLVPHFLFNVIEPLRRAAGGQKPQTEDVFAKPGPLLRRLRRQHGRAPDTPSDMVLARRPLEGNPKLFAIFLVVHLPMTLCWIRRQSSKNNRLQCWCWARAYREFKAIGVQPLSGKTLIPR